MLLGLVKNGIFTARYYPHLRVTKYCNRSLKITISVPDHSLPAKCREWSGISNFVIRYGVVTGSGVGVCKGVCSCVLVVMRIRIKGDSFAL